MGLLACGACADAMLLRACWVMPAVLPLVFVLGLDFLVLRAWYGRRHRKDPDLPLHRWQSVGCAATIVVALGLGVTVFMGSSLFVGLLLLLGLAGLFVGSLLVRRPRSVRFVAVRVVVVLVAALLLVLAARPGARDTDELVGIVARSSSDGEPGWAERELLTREDGLARVDSRLSRRTADDVSRHGELAAELLRLHRELGGAEAERMEHCRRLGLPTGDRGKDEMHGLQPGLCGEVPPG